MCYKFTFIFVIFFRYAAVLSTPQHILNILLSPDRAFVFVDGSSFTVEVRGGIETRRGRLVLSTTLALLATVGRVRFDDSLACDDRRSLSSLATDDLRSPLVLLIDARRVDVSVWWTTGAVAVVLDWFCTLALLEVVPMIRTCAIEL